jgi:solute carrier family 25 S-adenosylmethionine transporter 26
MEIDKAKVNFGPSIYWTSLIAGGVAGLFVDISLFPIDTIKTRLQSENGFWRSGGFRQIYKGIGPVVAGSGKLLSFMLF